MLSHIAPLTSPEKIDPSPHSESRTSEDNRGKRITKIQLALYVLIIVGTLIRIAYPFFCNPLAWTYSDPLRHYQNALNPQGSDIMNLLDSPGYEVWLSTILRFTYDSKVAVALYAGILSAITPWFWYRWMRECLPSKTLALVGYAILALLPSWIRMFSYFMQETLLLPLLGIALWMSWRAARKGELACYLIAAVAWGCASATKTNAIPLELIVFIWLVKNAIHQCGLRRGLIVGASTLLIMLAIYSLGPLKLYNRTHVALLVPTAPHSQLYYESGNARMEFDYKFADSSTGKPFSGHWFMESPYMGLSLFSPLSDWQSSRTGVYSTTLDFTKDPSHFASPIYMPLSKRLRLTLENMIFFFYGITWPMEKINQDSLETLLVSVRWLWLPLTLAISWLAIKRRRANVLTVLCLGSLLVYLLQQSCIMEARYRMPWEGVAIASFLYLLPARSGEQNEFSWERIRIPVISGFLVLYLFFIGLWLLPPSNRRDAILRPIEPLILYTGLWQAWTMFSPDPKNVNLDLDAIISFSDGSKTVWYYPRMERLGFFERIQKERFRKFGHDHLNWGTEQVLWPDFARWVARINNRNGRQPVSVTLERHWAYVPPPKDGLGKLPLPHSNQYTFFTYTVKPEDLI